MKLPNCICGDAPIITVADSAITISCEHCAGMSATARSLAGAAGLWERVVSDKEYGWALESVCAPRKEK